MKLTKTMIREAIKKIDIDQNNKFIKILFEDCDSDYLLKKSFEQLKFASISGLPITEEQIIDILQVLVLALVKLSQEKTDD